jgi:hypothetical protein
MNVPIKKLSGLLAWTLYSKESLRNDPWSGKPPFRYFDIGVVITSPKYFV